MQWIQVVLWGLVLLGHTALWVAVSNRAHAAGWSQFAHRWSERCCALIILVGAVVWTIWGFGVPPDHLPNIRSHLASHPALGIYLLVCMGLGCLIPTVWLVRRLAAHPPTQLVSNDTERVDVAAECGHRPIGNWQARIFDLVPGNEIFALQMHEKTLRLDGLPAALDGFTITHLSDLHFSGKIARSYFEYVVERANAFDSDLVAVTGDILDKPPCLDWIPTTLGRLRSRLGIYFILGNHETRLPDIEPLRTALTDIGLRELGGRIAWTETRGCRILLAGNERPWFDYDADFDRRVDAETAADFRILLSHSPDQIRWARRHRFDLMLAGHTHGGQIRLPIVGPVVSPSHYGVKYSSGVFFEPPTLLHVTRGISALVPLRLNCPPEITKLVLRSQQPAVN